METQNNELPDPAGPVELVNPLVIEDGQRAVLKVGDTTVAMPTSLSPDTELNAFNRLLMQTQLGAIERRKQRELRTLVADAEIEILRDRTSSIIRAHRGLTRAALVDILAAATVYGREALYREQLAHADALQRAILRCAVQYTEFIATIPADLPEPVGLDLRRHAEQIYLETMQKIRNTKFTAE